MTHSKTLSEHSSGRAIWTQVLGLWCATVVGACAVGGPDAETLDALLARAAQSKPGEPGAPPSCDSPTDCDLVEMEPTISREESGDPCPGDESTADASCKDVCPSDPDKTEPGACGCGLPDINRDGDSLPDCLDQCPDDPGKTRAGVCGCGLSDKDVDGDGSPDCSDTCPEDPDKGEPGACGCNQSDVDGDTDGVADCLDECPHDPDQSTPGACGCNPADTDGDATPDCIDECPNDPEKDTPDTCGCGVSDSDRDLDGTLDCLDRCPLDPAKTDPEICGCGMADTDVDGDGTLDCQESCPEDPLKTAPGACGCGIAETDFDADGIPDCNDDCVPESGLMRSYYLGRWQEWPDLANRTPDEIEVVQTLNVADAFDTPGFSVVFEGYIDIPNTDEISFFLSTSHGARLAIDGDTVLQVAKPNVSTQGSRALTPGLHEVRLVANFPSNPIQLALGYRIPGQTAWRAIPRSWWYHGCGAP